MQRQWDFNQKVRYANYIICIFMNLNEKIEMIRIAEEKGRCVNA